MPITHTFVTTIADDATAQAAGQVLPSHWNADHTISLAASEIANTPAGNIAATDVQTALNELDSEKQATLVSATNIKTINSNSLLGSGDLAISGMNLGANTFTDTQTVQKAVDATSTDGDALETTTAATVGAQKYSPRIRWKGYGWKTNATAGSQAVEFAAEVQPVQGTAAPTGNLVFKSAINGGAYSDVLKIGSAGELTLTGPSSGYATIFGTAQFREMTLLLGYNVSGGAGVALGNASGASVYSGLCQAGAMLVSTGVYGISPNTLSNTPDVGLSRISAGVWGVGTGAAGSYAGSLKLTNIVGQAGYTEMVEMTAPTAPAANTVRLYCEDNGAGKTRLMALFPTGAAQQVAIEP